MQAQAYIDAYAKARGWHERLRIIQNAANSLERKGLEAGLSRERVAILRAEFFVKNHLPAELALMGDIAATTEAQKAKWGQLETSAKIWTEIIHKIVQSWKTILAILNADSMDPDGPFFSMLKSAVNITGYIDQHIDKWIEYITEAAALLGLVFAAKPEEEGKPSEPSERPPTDSTMDPFLQPQLQGFDQGDFPVKLEKLILEFRRFNENLRNGIGASPDIRHASMATPGLQLPPAAPAGDIYTDKYGVWPGGGAKPAGSDVGPGSGEGAGGLPDYPGPFRDVPRGRSTRGGIPLGRPPSGDEPVGGALGDEPWKPRLPISPERLGIRGTAGAGRFGGAALGQALRTDTWEERIRRSTGGLHDVYSEQEVVPGKSQTEGGTLPEAGEIGPELERGMEKSLREYQSPSYRFNREELFNPQGRPIRYGGSSGSATFNERFGTGGPGATFSERFGGLTPSQSVFERTSPLYPVDPGKAIQVPGDQAMFESLLPGIRTLRETLTRGKPTFPGEEHLRAQDAQKRAQESGVVPDRRVIDQGMGNEISGTLSGGIELNITAKGPPGTEVKAEGTGIIDSTEVNREMSLE